MGKKKGKKKQEEKEPPDPRMFVMKEIILNKEDLRKTEEKTLKKALLPLKRVNSNPLIYEWVPISKNIFPDSKSVDYGFEGVVDIPNQVYYKEEMDDEDFNLNEQTISEIFENGVGLTTSLSFMKTNEIDDRDLDDLNNVESHDALDFLKTRVGKDNMKNIVETVKSPLLDLPRRDDDDDDGAGNYGDEESDHLEKTKQTDNNGIDSHDMRRKLHNILQFLFRVGKKGDDEKNSYRSEAGQNEADTDDTDTIDNHDGRIKVKSHNMKHFLKMKKRNNMAKSPLNLPKSEDDDTSSIECNDDESFNKPKEDQKEMENPNDGPTTSSAFIDTNEIYSEKRSKKSHNMKHFLKMKKRNERDNLPTSDLPKSVDDNDVDYSNDRYDGGEDDRAGELTDDAGTTTSSAFVDSNEIGEKRSKKSHNMKHFLKMKKRNERDDSNTSDLPKSVDDNDVKYSNNGYDDKEDDEIPPKPNGMSKRAEEPNDGADPSTSSAFINTNEIDSEGSDKRSKKSHNMKHFLKMKKRNETDNSYILDSPKYVDDNDVNGINNRYDNKEDDQIPHKPKEMLKGAEEPNDDADQSTSSAFINTNEIDSEGSDKRIKKSHNMKHFLKMKKWNERDDSPILDLPPKNLDDGDVNDEPKVGADPTTSSAFMDTNKIDSSGIDKRSKKSHNMKHFLKMEKRSKRADSEETKNGTSSAFPDSIMTTNEIDSDGIDKRKKVKSHNMKHFLKMKNRNKMVKPPNIYDEDDDSLHKPKSKLKKSVRQKSDVSSTTFLSFTDINEIDNSHKVGKNLIKVKKHKMIHFLKNLPKRMDDNDDADDSSGSDDIYYSEYGDSSDDEESLRKKKTKQEIALRRCRICTLIIFMLLILLIGTLVGLVFAGIQIPFLTDLIFPPTAEVSNIRNFTTSIGNVTTIAGFTTASASDNTTFTLPSALTSTSTTTTLSSTTSTSTSANTTSTTTILPSTSTSASTTSTTTALPSKTSTSTKAGTASTTTTMASTTTTTESFVGAGSGINSGQAVPSGEAEIAIIHADMYKINDKPVNTSWEYVWPPNHRRGKMVENMFFAAYTYLGFTLDVVICDILRPEERGAWRILVRVFGKPRYNLDIMKWYGFDRKLSIELYSKYIRRMERYAENVLLSQQNAKVKYLFSHVGHTFAVEVPKYFDKVGIRRPPSHIPAAWSDCFESPVCDY
ncbi:uncharacterized protein LOC120338827 isoform X2 [Styela clava]